MKVISKKPEFIPIELLIKIETVEEAQAIYAIFNSHRNSRLLGKAKARLVRDELDAKYYKPGDEIIANEISGHEFYGE